MKGLSFYRTIRKLTRKIRGKRSIPEPLTEKIILFDKEDVTLSRAFRDYCKSQGLGVRK